MNMATTNKQTTPVPTPTPIEKPKPVSKQQANEALLKGLHNRTPASLVDEIIDLRKQQATLAVREGVLTEALKARTDPPLTQRENWVKWDQKVIKGDVEHNQGLQVYLVNQERFDTKSFREANPDLAAEFTKQLSFIQMKAVTFTTT